MFPSATRVGLHDNSATVLAKLSEGNPGALSVLLEILNKGSEIDPYVGHGMMLLLNLDSLGIYGPRVWTIYKDVCGCSLPKTVALLRSWQLDILDRARLLHAVDHRGAGIDVDAVCLKVKERLPAFNLS